MKRQRGRLRNRLMLAFAGFTMFVTLLFGLYVIVFAYTVEDMFFKAMLEREAAEQLDQHALTGHWQAPRESFITVIEDEAALPENIAATLRAEPGRTEFAGNTGHHYHLKVLKPPAPAPRAWLVAEVSQQLVIRPMRTSLFRWLAGSGIVVIALALLLGVWLSRRITAPLTQLAALVDDMHPASLPTAFSQRFPDDEVGVLARGLESLSERTQAFIAREREFTRDASHELRTPLAVIRSACERLADEPGLGVAGKRHLEHVQQSARQLEQTVITLLSLAREEQAIDTGIPVTLLPILERVIVEQSPWLEHKDICIDLHVPTDTLLALPAPIAHILLSNLIGNAFAHTTQGRVRIDVDADRLRIANSGAGIRDADYLPHVKGEDSAGFGLGLAIVRRLCERYGIDLEISSTGNETVASLALGAPVQGH